MNTRKIVYSLLPLLFLFINTTAFGFFETPDRNVLILNSYHKGYGWSERLVAGIESVIKGWEGYDFYYEYMDTKRITTPEYLEALERIYKLKYQNTKFDLIMVSDDNGLKFCLKNHDTIFKRAPMVFCGINKFEDSMLKGHKNVTGVVEKYDPLDTLNSIYKIFPHIRNYISISDATVSGLINKSLLEEALKKFPVPVNYIPWHNLSYEKLEKKISAAPKDAVIIFQDLNRDGKGKLISDKMSHQLLEKSPIPVFGRLDWMLNHNYFGGMIVSGFFQGKVMAQLGERVLNGGDISTIPVIKESPNRYMFDYKVMAKFDVLKSDLPEKSIILNEPPTFIDIYKKNKVLFFRVATVFFLSIAIILLISIRLIWKSRKERGSLIIELQQKLGQIKTLHGLLPICSNCKKIRDDKGYWSQIETYISKHSEAHFSHGICDECAKELYGWDPKAHRKNKKG